VGVVTLVATKQRPDRFNERFYPRVDRIGAHDEEGHHDREMV
jgi:hypothetical protein